MNLDIVRAWKDATYRSSLSAEEQAMLPANPAGTVELSDTDLEAIYGAGKENDNSNKVIVTTNGLLLCTHSSGNQLLNINAALGLLGVANANGAENSANVCLNN